MSTSAAIPLDVRVDVSRLQRYAISTGGILFVLSIIGAFFNPDQFFHSYLFGYLFWIGIALGSMAFLMMQYLTSGAWGVVSRRTFEAATRTLPLLALLFIPIAIGIRNLYPWANPELVHGDDVLSHRSAYMNPTMFILRAIVYFLIWYTFIHFLNKWSAEEDEVGNRRRALERLSAPGLILYVFTVTFSSVDWSESLDSHWFSTMWGFLFVAHQGLAALCFAIVALALLSTRKPMSDVLRPSHFHDLGKLLLMMVMLWAYFAFSQLLIIWAGNLSNEISWYVTRFNTSWRWFGIALMNFQFIVPFVLLLSRSLKKNPGALSFVVGILLVMRFVDLYWVVMPEFLKTGVHIHWLNFSVPLAIGGIWLWTFLWQLSKRPLMPLQDPNLERALEHEGLE